MNSWISIKDQLPKEGEEVLVLVDGHRGPSWCNTYMLVAYMSQTHKFWEERHIADDPLAVTHWMPLPDMPKEALSGRF